MSQTCVSGNEVDRLRVLSLGAGVQSTTIALMMAAGEIAPADRAVFADTQSEPASVYTHLEWLRAQLPFQVDVVTAGNLGDEILGAARGNGRNDARPPFYVKNGNGTRGILRRQCTGDYKIDVIRKHVRGLLGVKRGARVPKTKHVTQIIGISRDEAGRMRVSQDKWQTNEYPLVDLRMTRWDCEQWLRRHGFSIPSKSACVFCPYRRIGEWRRMRDESPADFAKAVEIDEAIRAPGYGRLLGECYVHDSMTPLAEVDLSTDAENGQPNLWDDECEGVCGV